METIKNMLRFKNKIILVNSKVRFFYKKLFALSNLSFPRHFRFNTFIIHSLDPLSFPSPSICTLYVCKTQSNFFFCFDGLSKLKISFSSSISIFFLIFGELLSFTRSLDDPSTPQDAFGVISLSNNSKPLSSLSWQGRADALGIIWSFYVHVLFSVHRGPCNTFQYVQYNVRQNKINNDAKNKNKLKL